MPEPMWVEAQVEISLRVKVDVAGLVHHNRLKGNGYVTDAGPLDYDDITEDYLRQYGYGPAERGTVFIHNNIEDTVDVSAWHGGTSKDGKTRLIEETPFGDTVEIHFRWDERQQEELDARLPKPVDTRTYEERMADG